MNTSDILFLTIYGIALSRCRPHVCTHLLATVMEPSIKPLHALKVKHIAVCVCLSVVSTYYCFTPIPSFHALPWEYSRCYETEGGMHVQLCLNGAQTVFVHDCSSCQPFHWLASHLNGALSVPGYTWGLAQAEEACWLKPLCHNSVVCRKQFMLASKDIK